MNPSSVIDQKKKKLIYKPKFNSHKTSRTIQTINHSKQVVSYHYFSELVYKNKLQDY